MRKGKKPVIRAYKENKEDSLKYRPTYVFAENLAKLPGAIPVVFEGERLRGKVEHYYLDPRRFDSIVYQMYKDERRKARTAFYFLQTENFIESSIAPLREKARELFVSMQIVDEEIRHTDGSEQETQKEIMKNLDAEFHELIEEQQFRLKTLTMRNPWLLTVLKYNDADGSTVFTQSMVEEFCLGLRITGSIEDGRVVIEKAVAVPRYAECRDALPGKLVSSYSQHTYSAKGKEMYRIWQESHASSSRSKK